MVSAWYFNDSSKEDPRGMNQYSPNRCVSLDELAKLGVLYWHFDVTQDRFEDRVDQLMQERQYKNRDLVGLKRLTAKISISKETLPNYDEKLKSFFTEHLHDDEEIRLIVEGAGYFDIRSQQDEWIRIQTVPGDMILLPAGIYHRFILDTTNYIKAMRIFKEVLLVIE